VTAQLGCDHRLGLTRIEKFLNLDSVGQNQMPVICYQVSATLLQVEVLITSTLEVVALPFRIRDLLLHGASYGVVGRSR